MHACRRSTPAVSDSVLPPLLEIVDLQAGYGRSQVLFGLSFCVPQIGAVAILGRNGAGKTTLLKTLAGEIKPSSGCIRLAGQDVTSEAAERRARLGIGHVPQEHAIFARMSVRENLMLGAGPRADRRAMEEVLELFPKLGTRLDQTAGTLSGGERKMLAISRALLGKPRVLMLDEPTEGVWIGVIDEIAERLVELSRSMSLILVEQHVELAFAVGQTAYVIDRGEVALWGTTGKVRSDPALLRLLAP